jgi:hypothetical protein
VIESLTVEDLREHNPHLAEVQGVAIWKNALDMHLQKQYHKEPHPSDILLDDMVKTKGGLFDNAADNYPDISFVAEGRSIPAHRGVLAAGSEYFRLNFISPLQAGDSSSREVRETTYETLRTVLKYIYTQSHRDVLTPDNVLDVCMS